MRYEDIMEYVQRWVGRGDRLQQWAAEKSSDLRSEGVFAIDPTRGRFLELVARLVSPKKVLEIGSGAGYSALWFMKGMGRKGRLEAVEGNPRVAETLALVLKTAGLSKRVQIRRGPALQVLRGLKGPYDIIFIDADKDEYAAYLENALRLTRPGNVILADNMFWHGSTIDARYKAEGTGGILEYTKRIFADDRLSSIIVPLGDGMAFSIRTR